MSSPRLRFTVRLFMVAIAVVAALCGIYMYFVRESMRPTIGFVGNEGTHRSRRMTDEEIAKIDRSLLGSAFRSRGQDHARNGRYDQAIDDFTVASPPTRRPPRSTSNGALPGRPGAIGRRPTPTTDRTIA